MLEICDYCDRRVCTQEGENARVHEDGHDYMAIGRNLEECRQQVAEKLSNMNQMNDGLLTHIIEH